MSNSLNSKSTKKSLFVISKAIASKDDKLECAICSKAFSYKFTLNRHMKEQHTNFERVKCNICGNYQIPQRLNEHRYLCLRSLINYNNNKCYFPLLHNTIITNNFTANIALKDEEYEIKKIFEKIILENESNIDEYFCKCFAFRNMKIGKGCFGKVLFGITKNLDDAVAIKIQKSNWKNEELLPEYDFLQNLQNYEFFPKIYGYEHNKKGNYIIEELLGPNLSNLFEFCNYNFDIKTICNIGIDLFSSINAIHDEGLLHLDIKKSNILWKFKNNKKNLPDMCLIDFNLTRKSGDNERKDKRGNIKYSSLDVLLGKKIHKKDDLISIVYLIMDLFNNELPWSNSACIDHEERKKIIIKEKQTFKIEKYITKEIEEKREIYSLIFKLKESDEPNYIYYQKLLLRIIEKNKIDTTQKYRFKWEEIIEEKFREAKTFKNNCFIKNKLFKTLFKGYPEAYVNFYLSKYMK